MTESINSDVPSVDNPPTHPLSMVKEEWEALPEDIRDECSVRAGMMIIRGVFPSKALKTAVSSIEADDLSYEHPVPWPMVYSLAKSLPFRTRDRSGDPTEQVINIAFLLDGLIRGENEMAGSAGNVADHFSHFQLSDTSIAVICDLFLRNTPTFLAPEPTHPYLQLVEVQSPFVDQFDTEIPIEPIVD